jgi:crotonobetainyl-CoA:carnitine CoA-transferase CaiB-like acyl-CoA transferase
MKEAILIALFKKQKQDNGSIIHISLYKSALSALANQASNYLMENHIPKPIGTLHPNIAPYGDQFHDKNGKSFLLAIGSDAQFLKLWETLSLPMEKMFIFEVNSDRLVNRGELQATLQEVFNVLTFEYLEDLFIKHKLPMCEIKDLSQVLTTKEALEMVNTEKINGLITKSMSQIAFSFD